MGPHMSAEDPKAFSRFKRVMKAVVKVPHSVIQERVEEHRRQSAENPNRRGPKPNSKYDSSPRRK